MLLLPIAVALRAATPPGSQPHGGLAGKIVYLHGGHGYTADAPGRGDWGSQRPLLLGMIEDLGNKDQMDFLADYLWRSGATIAALRPVGHQPNEVVLDNADPAVTFHGDWSDGAGPIWFGGAGEGDPGVAPFRIAQTSPQETAYARYRPKIAEAGFYPVYCWTPVGDDRAADQLYRIHHAGGDTEVAVNHRRVGAGTVYLGTFYFEAGDGGYVDVSNRSDDAGKIVVADMIRFGNGRGDIDRGGGVSGLNREDEAGLYWVQWHADRAHGVPTTTYRELKSDRDATISLAPRYARFMNRAQDGAPSDRVFISFHSNASEGGAQRGVLGLYNGNGRASATTPNQFRLAELLAREVNDDLVAQAGRFEHDWFDRGKNVTLDRTDLEFGEINNEYGLDEFDATIIETGFHDNRQDAEMLRDPRVRDALARATYQGLLKYFAEVDGGNTNATALPPAPTGLCAAGLAAGEVTLSWAPPATSGSDTHGAKSAAWAGGPPTGYRVYASPNGYGFDVEADVRDGAATACTLAGLEPNRLTFFYVVATNAGGESSRSHVVACVPRGKGPRVLVVDGFDRNDRTLNPTQKALQGGDVERVWPRGGNTQDYVVPTAAALHAAGPDLAIDSASDDSVASGSLRLEGYAAAFWILGAESSDDQTLSEELQARLKQFLEQGGRLMVSGSEAAWDLDHLDHGRNFFRETLHAQYVADDAQSSEAKGVADSIFSGLELRFGANPLAYSPKSPDVLRPVAGGELALTYAGGQAGAGVTFNGTAGDGKVVLLGFPFETIAGADDRQAAMERVLRFFAVFGDR
ncbi:golvesin C-terminal-like domain-containing protein [Pirellulimonas nuda]|uniref:golvesin C-terminal-like domain-containing protein n=1 Tax=Pirellulimonas nuda TaxID=2528009 RepID=UPI00119D3C3A|nr:N-acetylmuramoyl-L-alanine amidase [Pirellulimonas nuda]